MAENLFACGTCGKPTPYAQGNATRAGLVCMACTPQTHIDADERAAANDPNETAREHRAREGIVDFLAELLENVIGNRT